MCPIPNQTKTLLKFEEYSNTAIEIKAVGNILTTDKIGAGVNVSVDVNY